MTKAMEKAIGNLYKKNPTVLKKLYKDGTRITTDVNKSFGNVGDTIIYKKKKRKRI